MDRVTHKESDCKDDLKLLNLTFLRLNLVFYLKYNLFNGFINEYSKKETSLKLQGIINIRK